MPLKLVNFFHSKVRHSPFTATGRLLFVACLFCLFAIVDLSLAQLLSQTIWLLIVGFCTGVLFRPKLNVELRCPPVTINRQSFEFQVVVTNIGKIGAYDLQFELDLPPNGLWSDELTKSVASIAAGASITIPYTLTPTQRGVFVIKRFTVASLFPLSLFRFLTNHKLAFPIYVAPSYEERSSVVGDVVDQLSVNEWAGSTHSNSLLEYIGSREFRPGVPVRRWDFSSWARLGIPSVREFSEGSETIVIVVVDTSRRTKSFDPTLEAALSTTTGILVHCANKNQSTMLVTVANEIEFGRILTDRGQCDDALIRLAKVEGELDKIDWLKAWDALLSETPGNAILVAILSDPNAFSQLQQQNVSMRRVVPYMIRPGETASATTTNLPA